jgi:hypothetical protein
MMGIFVLASISTFMFYMYAQRAIHLDWRRRLMLFPVFMAGSMGFAVNNTKAVFEALTGKKSAFLRTPKYKIVGADGEWKKKKYVQKKIGGAVFMELFFTLYFIVGISISVFYLEIAAIPFQLLFLAGFGTVGAFSFKTLKFCNFEGVRLKRTPFLLRIYHETHYFSASSKCGAFGISFE